MSTVRPVRWTSGRSACTGTARPPCGAAYPGRTPPTADWFTTWTTLAAALFTALAVGVATAVLIVGVRAVANPTTCSNRRLRMSLVTSVQQGALTTFSA
jgi:hypothetical protein